MGSDFKPYYRFLDKELHGTYSLNGDLQQCSRRRAVTYYPGKASPNHHNSSGTSHQTELGPRRTNTAKEHLDRYPRGRPRRYQWEIRDREGPKGSNAPRKPERQDISHLSVTDTAPPYIVAEMQMMKERMDLMMNTLKGRVSNDLDDLVQRPWWPGPSNQFTFNHILQLLPTTKEVSHAADRKLRQSQWPSWSPGDFQDLNAPSRSSRWDHV